MTHKVHPKAFRIKGVSSWLSHGFYGKKPKNYLKEDFEIRKFLKKRLKECGIENIIIERLGGKMNIIIESSRPAFIIGRGGKGVEDLKKEIESKVFKGVKMQECKIEIKGIRNPWTRSGLIGQWIAYRLEKRFPYRRTLKQALQKIMAHKEIQGARVEVAGRLDGVEISRTEWLKKGRLPLQTLRADIDYGTTEAFCSFGVIGIKVWLYKGDKFD